MTKRIAAAIATAMMLLITGAAVQNQSLLKVSGVVVHAPSDRESVGPPIQDARVEYRDASTGEVQIAYTDSEGNFEFAAERSGIERSGIVTASKEDLATISVGWPPREQGSLRIELPQAAVLEGALYGKETDWDITNAVVTVMVSHPVSPLSDSIFTETGEFAFEGLPPGPAVVVAHAPGFEPVRSENYELSPGGVQEVNIGLRLEGTVSGRVFEPDEIAVGAEVFLVYNDRFANAEAVENFVGGRLVTGADGEFLVNGIVPKEAFFLYAETEDGRRSNRTPFEEVQPGGTIEKVNLHIPR